MSRSSEEGEATYRIAESSRDSRTQMSDSDLRRLSEDELHLPGAPSRARAAGGANAIGQLVGDVSLRCSVQALPAQRQISDARETEVILRVPQRRPARRATSTNARHRSNWTMVGHAEKREDTRTTSAKARQSLRRAHDSEIVTRKTISAANSHRSPPPRWSGSTHDREAPPKPCSETFGIVPSNPCTLPIPPASALFSKFCHLFSLNSVTLGAVS